MNKGAWRRLLESRLVDGWKLLVDGLSQGLARLEVGHQLFRDGDLLAGARVAAHARRAPADRETAEAADLDAVPARERVGHRIEHGLDRELGVTHGDLRKPLSELSDEVGPCHRDLLALVVVELRAEQGAQARRAGVL